MARWAEVGYLRRLVEFGPHTVAHEVPHDGAAVCFHVLLHRVGDIIDPVAGAGELDALPEALFGHMDQMHGLVAHLSAGEGGGAVAVEAVQKGAHVHADDVALLQLPGTYRDCFDGVAVGAVEEYYQRAICRFNKRQLAAVPPSIYTAVAYLELKELELSVLINVIESVKYGVPYRAELADLVGQ